MSLDCSGSLAAGGTLGDMPAEAFRHCSRHRRRPLHCRAAFRFAAGGVDPNRRYPTTSSWRARRRATRGMGVADSRWARPTFACGQARFAGHAAVAQLYRAGKGDLPSSRDYRQSATRFRVSTPDQYRAPRNTNYERCIGLRRDTNWTGQA